MARRGDVDRGGDDDDDDEDEDDDDFGEGRDGEGCYRGNGKAKKGGVRPRVSLDRFLPPEAMCALGGGRRRGMCAVAAPSRPSPRPSPGEEGVRDLRRAPVPGEVARPTSSRCSRDWAGWASSGGTAWSR